MSLFSEFEKAVERAFRRWTEKMFGKAESDDLLLVHRAVLEKVESRIEPAQRGKPLFPYNHVTVRLSTPDEHRRAIYMAAFVDGARLEADVRQFLAGTGCEVPRAFAVDVEILDAPDTAVDVRFDMRASTVAEPARAARARIVMLTGKTTQPVYELNRTRTNVGRMAQVLDREHRPLRRNDIVFEEEGGEVNTTVSRSHAHIRYDPASGEYRVSDDGSEYGTRIFRDGRSIEVPRANNRGERLRPGDEIYFGQACARFEVDV